MNETQQETPRDNRLSWSQAVRAIEDGRIEAAFAATPVFGDEDGDEDQTAEGARIFLLVADDGGDCQLRFIAGPFFSAAYAANEVMEADEAPDSVRALRFMPTRCEEDWLSDQIQVLLQRLMQASGQDSALMPDYASQPGKGASAATVFPVSFIGGKGVH